MDMSVRTTVQAIRLHGSDQVWRGLMRSQTSSPANPLSDVVSEYETLLRSLLPKLDEHDRTRVLKKVFPEVFPQTESYFSLRGGPRILQSKPLIHILPRLVVLPTRIPLAVMSHPGMCQRDFLVLVLISVF